MTINAMNENITGIPALDLLARVEGGLYEGNWRMGEIQLDRDSFPPKIVYEDPYVAVVRDPVRFPGAGRRGTYLRIIEKGMLDGGVAGVVVVPRFCGKFVLIRNFRHSSRSWKIEFPRGFFEPGKSPAENAERELFEELGVRAAQIQSLGLVSPNSGLLTSIAQLFLADLEALPACPRYAGLEEAISGHITTDLPGLKSMIGDGTIDDAFTIAAAFHLIIRDDA